MAIDSGSTLLKRVAIFYDGSFFMNLSNYFAHQHAKKKYLSFSGLHEFIRERVAIQESNQNTALCQIVEAHFFRGRFSLDSVQKRPDPLRQLENDRFVDELLMRANLVTHYYPMNETVSPPTEKGIDVWLALEAYDLAVHKRYDVLALVTGDQDFVPLVRKLNSLGTRVMIVGANVTTNPGGRPIVTSQALINEASYAIILDEEIDSKKSKSDASVNLLFVP